MIFGLRIKNLLIHPTGDYDVHMVNVQRATQRKHYQPAAMQPLPKVFGFLLWRRRSGVHAGSELLKASLFLKRDPLVEFSIGAAGRLPVTG